MTTQKKNTMIPGMAYPATVLALATAVSYPPATAIFRAPGYWRRDLKLARISSQNSWGCSQAAKWPPRSRRL
jgi:hypothetical protein